MTDPLASVRALEQELRELAERYRYLAEGCEQRRVDLLEARAEENDAAADKLAACLAALGSPSEAGDAKRKPSTGDVRCANCGHPKHEHFRGHEPCLSEDRDCRCHGFLTPADTRKDE